MTPRNKVFKKALNSADLKCKVCGTEFKEYRYSEKAQRCNTKPRQYCSIRCGRLKNSRENQEATTIRVKKWRLQNKERSSAIYKRYRESEHGKQAQTKYYKKPESKLREHKRYIIKLALGDGRSERETTEHILKDILILKQEIKRTEQLINKA